MGEFLAILASIVTIVRGGRGEIKELFKSRKKSETKSSTLQPLESTHDDGKSSRQRRFQ